jgi:catechol 2,3-dioxygenase-like lactoylglutathione lyase family enzyme
MVKTQGVVHFSLPVTDLECSAKFYSELLGMRVVQKTPRMVFLQVRRRLLHFGQGQHSLEVRFLRRNAGASCLQSGSG